MPIESFGEYAAMNIHAVRELLRDDPPGVQVVYDTLVGVMTFYIFRNARGQEVNIGSDMQRKVIEEMVGASWRSIRRYLPTLIKKGLIRKRGNDVLQINPEFAYKGEGSLRAAACRQWHDTA